MIKDYYFMYDKLPDPLSNKENVELLHTIYVWFFMLLLQSLIILHLRMTN